MTRGEWFILHDVPFRLKRILYHVRRGLVLRKVWYERKTTRFAVIAAVHIKAELFLRSDLAVDAKWDARDDEWLMVSLTESYTRESKFMWKFDNPPTHGYLPSRPGKYHPRLKRWLLGLWRDSFAVLGRVGLYWYVGRERASLVNVFWTVSLVQSSHSHAYMHTYTHAYTQFDYMLFTLWRLMRSCENLWTFVGIFSTCALWRFFITRGCTVHLYSGMHGTVLGIIHGITGKNFLGYPYAFGKLFTKSRITISTSFGLSYILAVCPVVRLPVNSSIL